MKKLILIAVLPLLFCKLSAQNVNDKDFLILQKSNALLNIQLNEQKQTLLKQTKKIDSITSILQTATGEIKKNTAGQTSITQSISDLNEKTTNISQAFIDRRLYAIIAIIVIVIIVLIFFFYLKRKFSSVNNDIMQTETNLIKKISQTNDHINIETSEMKAQYEKQSKEINLAIDKQVKEINLAIEKQTIESNSSLKKLSADTAESINNLSDGFNKTIESQVTSVKGIFHEQHTQAANELSGKITELNKTVEKKIAAIKNELSANINEINVRLKNINPKE